MNYYNKGGQAYGLKSLAQELPKYGRYGDDVVAHISSDEARMLQSMGGSGTINPQTGLPEFFFKKAFQAVTKPVTKVIGQLNPLNPGSSLSKTINTTPIVGDVNKALNNVGTQIFQPLEKAIVQPASRGLAQFDKAVGNTIPGGWGTVGQVALSAMGAPVPLQVAYGAARGSGVMRKGGSFDLQGAMIGGATAYATAELGEYMRGAVPPEVAPTVDSYGNLVNPAPVVDYSTPLFEGANVAPVSGLPSLPAGVDPGYFDVAPTALSSAPSAGDFAGSLSDPTAGMVQAYTPPTPPPPAPSFLDRIGTKVGDAVGGTTKFIAEAPTTGVSEAAKTGQGALNLMGLGEGTAKEAAALAAKTGIKALPMTAMALYGETTLSNLDAQRDFLNQQKAAGNIAQAEYDAALADINRQRDYAARVVKDSPFSTNPDRDTSIGETYYGRGSAEDTLYGRGNERSTLYAMGGSVDDEYGMDESRNLGLGNLQKGLFGQGYAAGGTPRFLSGGGDGMSDSIRASINGTQEARLADGEFVIPADVVSHLGNGSSKAGAKQLYSMMDKVRKARTGNPKQGKQINPRKYLAA
jgi:hypothetical protein